jgi:hypothetical protein
MSLKMLSTPGCVLPVDINFPTDWLTGIIVHQFPVFPPQDNWLYFKELTVSW